MNFALKSGVAIRETENLGVAARLEVIMQLLNPTAIDEDGNIIHLTPFITKEQALELLKMAE